VAQHPENQESGLVSHFVPDLSAGGHVNYRMLRFALRGLVRQFLADLEDPKGATERQLGGLIRAGRDGAFLAAHGGRRIESLADFRAAIPVRSHCEFKPWLDRVAAGERRVLVSEPTQMLLETSGTTGTPKHLPVTRTWAEHVQQAQRLWTLALLRDHSTLAKGAALTMASPAVHAHSPGGLPIGSNTGRIRAAQPFWLRRRYAVPLAVMDIEDPEARQYAVLRFGLAADLRSITAANPSLILLLFRRLREWRESLTADLIDGTLKHGPAQRIPPALRTVIERGLGVAPVPNDWAPTRLWDLASVNCWTGGPATFFADRLQALMGDIPVREIGITASEGSFAFPLGADWPGSVLWMGGHVLEFIDDSGQAKWAWELEQGERVRLVVSTAAGLFRYDMADELEVVGRCLNTPLVRFVGKSGRYLNTVGERVTAAQISAAMSSISGDFSGFSVRAQMGITPHYLLVFEGETDESTLSKRFDEALMRSNVEYASKRASGRLNPVQFQRLPNGHYAQYRSRRVAEGAPEGQLKDPILALDDKEWAQILGKERVE
jgi:hypothetical protein